MEKLKNYDISFSGLNLGRHEFDFEIAQPFFDLFEFDQDFSKPELRLSIILDKKSNFLDLFFNLSGNIELICDITNEPYNQEVKAKNEIIVKFGEDFDFSDDDNWIIPFSAHSVNVAQMIYEMSLLAVPVKRIHPDVASGKSQSEMIDLLEKYSPYESDDSNEEEGDPRWEILKKLKNNNN